MHLGGAAVDHGRGPDGHDGGGRVKHAVGDDRLYGRAKGCG